MSEENKINKINQKDIPSEMNIDENNSILNSDFLKSLETPQKLPEKRSKITKLINFFQENQIYLKSLKETKNLEHLYDIILSNLNENNNNFVICQINLIKIIGEQISSNENEEIKSDFIKFLKNALPKLFDKFYLQNEKINNNLLDIFIFVIEKNILKYEDYFPLIENICIEEDEEYKINILNFMLKLINIDDNIYKENIPTNIFDTIEKLSKNEENEKLKEISEIILTKLNERKKEVNNNEDNEYDQLGITNIPLNQKDSKLAFSSFIRKISKAVREENLNKILVNNNSKIENLENNKKDININNPNNNNELDKDINHEVDKEKKFDEKNIVPQNEEIGKKFEENEEKKEKDEKNEEPLQKIDKINEIFKEQKEKDINLVANKSKDNIEQEIKNDKKLNENEEITGNNVINNEIIDNQENIKRIKSDIIQCQTNDENKLDIKDNNEKIEILQNNENNNEPQKTELEEEHKNMKKENKNKKIIKNRITRSRKLGVMVKNKINKNEEKLKEETDKKDLEENSIQISVNKINDNQKEILNEPKEEIFESSPKKEIVQNDITNNNIIKEEVLIKDDEEQINEHSEKKIPMKEPEELDEKNIIKEEVNDNKNNNLEKNIKESFDEIPIMINKQQILEDSHHEEENGQKISQKFSIDEFNKKIDSAL